ncbi:hypothetical protein jhhlp_003334 [Lomentospora prolificans]|uniref:LysM domain-containing protein n=1 Tax=Lomentospora prolificans TaxID=41688 RepID=A0A2N3NGI3_9PEZI|nr:hypothetical protein jhhlp_003334 [Lomentospora prolificans]
MASSSLLSSSTRDPDSSSVRPRNRRLISVEGGGEGATSRESSTIRGTARLASGSSTPLRDASPLPTHRLDVAPPERGRHDDSRRKKGPAGGAGFGFGLFEGSWATSWGAVQDIATSWISGGSRTETSNDRRAPLGTGHANRGRNGGAKPSRPWAQEATLTNTRPTIHNVGAGILAEREAALIAARTASVLESHDGVNGGLDVSGRFKHRTSDDVSRPATDPANELEDTLAYIHHVKPTDTYFGVILKYGCREEPFKKLNGLWSRDSISTRKWVAMPVDACEVKGKPCAGPSAASQKVDLLAPTPEAEIDDYGWRGTSLTTQQKADDVFGPSLNGSHAPEETGTAEDGDRPWTHVRWVSLDSFTEPVEIGRVCRKAMGYFPPRRKKSLLLTTGSTVSTPRQSLDVQSSVLGSVDGPDRGGPSSRRQSTLSSRPNLSSSVTGVSTPASTRSRMGSVNADARPAWMRRPGGVGSLNQSVRTPGPDKDPLNSWAKKHFPALVIDSIPSTSTTPIGTPQFGVPGDISVIAERSSVDTRDPAAPGARGTGLDRAAASVETWLRGAFAKRPGTPTGQAHWGEDSNDLIELTDTQSDDDRRASAEPSQTGLPSLLGVGREMGRSRSDMAVPVTTGRARLGATARAPASSPLGASGGAKNKDD